MKRDGALKSIWQDSADYKPAGNEPAEQHYDVVIAGAGITGLSTALLLQRSGLRCLVAEARNIGFGTTGGTTAHINTYLDTPYFKVIDDFGLDNAKLLALAARQAISLVRSNVEQIGIDCDFTELPGYLMAFNEEEVQELDKHRKGASEAEVSHDFIDAPGIAIRCKSALRFAAQAQFHPLKYLAGLAKAIEADGGTILSDCRVGDIETGDTIRVNTNRGQFTCNKLVYATHTPPGVNILHFRCAPYRSYVLACTLKDRNYPGSLLYDLQDPYYYYRTQIVDGQPFLIAGGCDHKTAHEDNTENRFRQLEAEVRKHFKIDKINYRWSSQYFEPADGLPYIGELPGFTSNVYVATGFSGNGITYGTVAAFVLRDLIVSGASPFGDLFRPSRVKPVAGFTNFVKEQADVISSFFTGHLNVEKIEGLSELAAGEGRVVKYEGRKLAVHRDEAGELHAVNPVCPHAKCTVSWNNSERSWDCPCHGSRFDMNGEMLTAPARSDLQKVELMKDVHSPRL